jgi:outer membrane protein OmpA-like peptidoglycan-associated protein
MGCASTHPATDKKEAQQVIKSEPCQEVNATIADDYPWSIPGHHSTIISRYSSFGITQVRGTPNQFTLCLDCPYPTPKSPSNANVAIASKNSASQVQKVVIQFEHASYLLSERERQLLTRFYQSLPEDYRLSITGYTDDTAPGGTITNDSLAQKRAQAVFDFLTSLGLKADTATLNASPLCCYVAPNSTDTGRALNRRAEVVMTSTSNRR